MNYLKLIVVTMSLFKTITKMYLKRRVDVLYKILTYLFILKSLIC